MWAIVQGDDIITAFPIRCVMRSKVIRIVGEVIEAIDGMLPVENIDDARELLEYGEWGEALHLIYTQLHEYGVKISQSTFDQIKLAGDKMGLDRKGWEVLEIEQSVVDVLKKCVRDYSSGANEQAIAKSLVRDGCGKLGSIAFLWRLFGLSLQEADQVYERAIQLH